MRQQQYFKLVKKGLPDHCRLAAKTNEPKRTLIQPCDRDGTVSEDAQSLHIRLSWLDPEFCISQNPCEEELAQYADYNPDLHLDRIRVRLSFCCTGNGNARHDA